MEQLLVRKIKGGFIGMKNGSKEGSEVWKYIKKLKEINEPLGEDFETQYIELRKKQKEENNLEY